MVIVISGNLFNFLAMNKQNIITWIILLTLTVIAGLVSGVELNYVVPLILLLAILKFIGVAFKFMEMKKANIFWKLILLSYLGIFCLILLVVL